MLRSVISGALILIAGLVAYVLLWVETYVATGSEPNLLTINAFLFLMGLSGALSLLSPPPSPFRKFTEHRTKWRDVNRETPDLVIPFNRRKAG